SVERRKVKCNFAVVIAKYTVRHSNRFVPKHYKSFSLSYHRSYDHWQTATFLLSQSRLENQNDDYQGRLNRPGLHWLHQREKRHRNTSRHPLVNQLLWLGYNVLQSNGLLGLLTDHNQLGLERI